jgi:Lar family restriction alleviation protein
MPNNQDVKLLPCPFCGGEDIDVSIYPYSTTIQCNKCQAFSPRYGCTNQISEKAAISRWNTRAPTPREAELEAQNKALWELVDALAHPYDFDAEEAMFQLKNLYNKSDDESGVFEVDDVTYKIVMINLSLLAEAQKLAAIQEAKEAKV